MATTDSSPTLQVSPSPGDVREAKEVRRQMAGSTGAVRLFTPSGTPVELPPPVAQLLFAVIDLIAEGKPIGLDVTDGTLTSHQAADRLNVSRPYLISLLDSGKIPHHRVNTHRRVYLRDVLAYKEESMKRSKQALAELVAMDQEDEFYEPKP